MGLVTRGKRKRNWGKGQWGKDQATKKLWNKKAEFRSGEARLQQHKESAMIGKDQKKGRHALCPLSKRKTKQGSETKRRVSRQEARSSEP